MPTPYLVAEICVGKNIMNKRFTSLMTTLILSVFFSISASAYGYDVKVDGIYYKLIKETKTAEVTNGDGLYSGEIIIPESITFKDTEFSVSGIGNSAFYDCHDLTSVTIPNSVTSIESYAFYNCKDLKNVYCYAEKVPSTVTDAFKDSYIEYATLHIPESAIDAYKTTEPWSGFGTIKALEGSEGETKKCETPTISFANGELVYNCATEGVEYVSEIKSNDINKFYTDKVSLSACYDISVTAMKTGYDNSDVATAKLYWLPSSGTLEGDNINNVSMRGIAIQSAGGFINISGLDNNEKVNFYGVDGKALGSAKSIDGNVSFSPQSGTIVVAKIGKESVKIAVE